MSNISKNIFEKIGLPKFPIFLAPLAGVSDGPFRCVSSKEGSDLCYVEMLSAKALSYRNKKTLSMLEKHHSEGLLGVQITGNQIDDLKEAVEIISNYSFSTIDINMGCPVRKVVNNGCGASLLKDPEFAYKLIKACVESSNIPVSVKIRLGWDHNSINYKDIGHAAQSAGASWITLHGRARSDDYSKGVDLLSIGDLKSKLSIPVIGNGNIFSKSDADFMISKTKVDGLMVSRGALGNPWVFNQIKGLKKDVSLNEWISTLKYHLQLQESFYNGAERAAIMMRKNLIWYSRGWPRAKSFRRDAGEISSFIEARELLAGFFADVQEYGVVERTSLEQDLDCKRFLWNPQSEMHRQVDISAY